MRAGRYVKQSEGYSAFIPAPLPPDPPVRLDSALAALLSDANLALGRLDGAATVLPNVDLFVAMYVRKEAVFSSQIEGTQASLTDVLEFEVTETGDERPLDTEEVVNYVAAMNYGLQRLKEFPLSLRLIREIHARLMVGVRGQNREPGEFRRTQNWIGPANATLRNATFVPPPPHQLMESLGDLENFLHDRTVPPLIHAGLVHAQFETIHPFLDGNGRMGRLLITFLLCERQVLSRPLLYLSHFLKLHRAEYYDRLQAVRLSGHWEEWLTFFLRGVREVSAEATNTAQRILELRENHRHLLGQQGKASGNLLRSLDHLFAQPIVTPDFLAKKMAVPYTTANNIIGRLTDLGLLREQTGQRRNRKFEYGPYLSLFENGTSPDGDTSTPPAKTLPQPTA